MFDEKFDEPAALAELFKFKTAQLSSSTKYVCKCSQPDVLTPVAVYNLLHIKHAYTHIHMKDVVRL